MSAKLKTLAYVSSTFCALLLCATPSVADTVIKINGPSFEGQAQAVFPDETPSATGILNKTERPSSFFILPHFLVETTNPGGEVTLLATRNEVSVANEVTVQIFPADSISSLTSLTKTLQPKEVWPISLRDALNSQTPDEDGFLRGWARIVSSGPTSVDYFQASPADAFAVGELPVDIDGGEFCEQYKVRFLIGGGFSGGTLLTLMMDLPLGDDTTEDPPSMTGTVYSESGAMINTFQLWTDKFSLQINAEELVLANNNAGSIDIRFQNVDNGFNGGAASVTHSASGLFSVGVKGFCLDPESL